MRRRRRPSGCVKVTPLSPHDRRLTRVALRWWHPSMLAAIVRALLVKAGILMPICDHCGGAGRLVKSQLFRRERCPVCRGTGRKLRRVA